MLCLGELEMGWSGNWHLRQREKMYKVVEKEEKIQAEDFSGEYGEMWLKSQLMPGHGKSLNITEEVNVFFFCFDNAHFEMPKKGQISIIFLWSLKLLFYEEGLVQSLSAFHNNIETNEIGMAQINSKLNNSC